MKKFNITGLCIPEKHYMVDTSKKVLKIIEMIDKGKYFIINRPRQYGKTTTLFMLERALKDRYLLISTSFEGLGETKFETEENFSSTIFYTLSQGLLDKNEDFKQEFLEYGKGLKTLENVSIAITKFVKQQDKKVVLMIDEVDKASNHTLFLNFLGMLRNKYLQREAGKDQTFHSVILAGVHDVKNIKKKIRPDSESHYNSPWNIATEFKVDLSFSAEEIETMLVDYASILRQAQHTALRQAQHTALRQAQHTALRQAQHTALRQAQCTATQTNRFDISSISKEIYKFTSGYPFLVSKICKVIDEDLDKDWSMEGIQKAITVILEEQNTLFDDLIKNVENHTELYELLYSILLADIEMEYNVYNPIINIGITYGILSKNVRNKLIVSNKIFEILLYNYMASKLEISKKLSPQLDYRGRYLDENQNLDLENVLLKFQEFIKETYSDKDTQFYERNGRLLLIAFVKPIINGSGFYYIEPQSSYERRMDMVITFNKKEYILEFKLWYGTEYHEKSLEQLAGYLDSRNHGVGYLVTFNFNKNKEFTNGWRELDNKKIFEVFV
ncbi:MAG: AAA family ATPase [Leptospiraceae bacterium]|nr:AAA family ATPase [Leptospiraceae bacterium]